MKKNIGKLDRFIRMTIAAFLTLLLLSNNILGFWGYVSAIGVLILFITALYGISPTYSILNISTIKKL